MAVYHRWRIYCHMWADCPYNGMDKFWAQCSVTSMGSLCLFTVITALISTSDHADVCENKNNFRNVNTFWRLLRGTKITADVCFWPKNAFSVSVSKCSLTECCNAWLLASCSILVTQKKQNFSVMLTSVLMVARCIQIKQTVNHGCHFPLGCRNMPEELCGHICTQGQWSWR